VKEADFVVFRAGFAESKRCCSTSTACGVPIAFVANEISGTGARYSAQVGGRGSQEAGLKAVYAYSRVPAELPEVKCSADLLMLSGKLYIRAMERE
jgi:hypothetical protein